MKLLLITVSSPHIRRIRKSRFLNFQQITMPYLAALTPPDWQVIHIDEEAEEIDFDVEVDLVGITFHTPSAKHAYRIADRFRARRIPVVFGGPHTTLVPEEAAQHADVIFIGEAEGLWQQFLLDFKGGRHKQVYQPTAIPSLEHVPQARKDLFHRKDHTPFPFLALAINGPPGSYLDRMARLHDIAGEYGRPWWTKWAASVTDLVQVDLGWYRNF